MQHISHVLVPILPLLQAPQTEAADVQVAPAALIILMIPTSNLLPTRDWDAEFVALQEENLGRYGY